MELLEGLAEIFGSEILPNRKYSFSSGKFLNFIQYLNNQLNIIYLYILKKKHKMNLF